VWDTDPDEDSAYRLFIQNEDGGWVEVARSTDDDTEFEVEPGRRYMVCRYEENGDDPFTRENARECSDEFYIDEGKPAPGIVFDNNNREPYDPFELTLLDKICCGLLAIELAIVSAYKLLDTGDSTSKEKIEKITEVYDEEKARKVYSYLKSLGDREPLIDAVNQKLSEDYKDMSRVEQYKRIKEDIGSHIIHSLVHGKDALEFMNDEEISIDEFESYAATYFLDPTLKVEDFDYDADSELNKPTTTRDSYLTTTQKIEKHARQNTEEALNEVD
jgi:hypothetical protein